LNNKPLDISSRIRSINDFGFIILEISSVLPEDSGTYRCVVQNPSGTDESFCELRCSGKAAIIRNSQLPVQMSGAQTRINELEAPKPEKPVLADQVELITGKINISSG